MTLHERVIATAYTSISFLSNDEMRYLRAYATRLLGREIDDIDIMSHTFWYELSWRSKNDFLEMIEDD